MFLVAKLNSWPFYFRDLLCKDQTSVVCQQGTWVNDEQIDCQEFLDFVFGEGTCPKLQPEPGVYKAEGNDLQYVLVKPSGDI